MIKVGISRDGKWYLFGGDISEIESGRWCDNAGNRPCAVCPDYGSNTLIVFGEKTEQLKYDVVFPIIHGTQGEDGTAVSYTHLDVYKRQTQSGPIMSQSVRRVARARFRPRRSPRGSRR